MDNVRSFIDWRCKLCGVEKSGGTPCIREHFLVASNGCGNRINGVRCKGVVGHKNATRCLRELLGGATNTKRQQNNNAPSPQGHQGQRSTDGATQDNTPTQGASTQEAALEFHHIGMSRTKQVSLEKSSRATTLEEA